MIEFLNFLGIKVYKLTLKTSEASFTFRFIGMPGTSTLLSQFQDYTEKHDNTTSNANLQITQLYK
mgnify:CR=1 FL=1